MLIDFVVTFGLLIILGLVTCDNYIGVIKEDKEFTNEDW